MANSENGGAAAASKELADQVCKTLKEGERLLAPTRRPDGTLRKSIRIRAGYVPQDEVAIYKSKGTLLKKEMESVDAVPPGYDPVLDSKPKSKSAKRNERKKEKRLLQHAVVDKGKSLDSSTEGDQALEPIDSAVSLINDLSISSNSSATIPHANSTDCSTPGDHAPDIDKKIRALKKKIRLTEAQQQKAGQDIKPEQLDKMAKLEDWRKELKLLEEQRGGCCSGSCITPLGINVIG